MAWSQTCKPGLCNDFLCELGKCFYYEYKVKSESTHNLTISLSFYMEKNLLAFFLDKYFSCQFVLLVWHH